MSEIYTVEAWKEECANASVRELFDAMAIYNSGNPLGWDEEIVGVLKAEIGKRVEARRDSDAKEKP